MSVYRQRLWNNLAALPMAEEPLRLGIALLSESPAFLFLTKMAFKKSQKYCMGSNSAKITD